MTLPDDSTVDDDQYGEIRLAAARALRDGGALGRFPTPVDDILHAAKIRVEPLALDEGYLAKLRRKAAEAGRALLGALSKVWGVFDPRARTAYIDPATPKEKVPFLKLHEGGHGLLPWQSLFGLFEDCRKTLDPEIKLQFEREANVFASEVLFQLDGFTAEAADHPFGLRTPISLSKRFGASVYATVRRYVTTSDRICVVLVFNPSEAASTVGFTATLRRAVPSPAFERRFPRQKWPTVITPDHQLGKLMPYGRVTQPRPFKLVDANGDTHELVGEAFKTPYQTFILLHAPTTLRRRLLLPERTTAR